MKLKYNFVTNQVADSIVAVVVGEDMGKFNGFIKLNETGAQIFGFLKEDISMEKLIEEMAKLYPDETMDTVKETVENFVDQLVKAGVAE